MVKTNGSANQHYAAPDFSKMMDLSKFMPGVKMPGFDMEAMMQIQRRQAEMLTEVGQQVLHNAQALMQRQGEMVRETMQETAQMFGQVMTGGTPEEKVAKHTEITKTTIEKAMANGRELAEMASKSNMAAAQALTSGFTEAMDNLRTAYTQK